VARGGVRAINQPIYPAYDGFLQNPDGSHTLSFAYFSHNSEPVTIPPGAENSFAPTPSDRQQPTTFRPGHWRFQCVIVVPANFDGKLRWTLTYAGTTTATSQNMMQSNWNLVEDAQELKKIDYAKMPKGVCLNRAPSVRVLGVAGPKRPLNVTTTEPFSLFGSVNDEGLPRNAKAVTQWKQVSGPAPVKFENAALARTHAVFAAPGELSASDSELSRSAGIVVQVK
jgi:hypothetical protein